MSVFGSHPAKHPLTRHGLHKATTDQDAVRAWWERRSWANIGVATGTRSGLVVIDADPANGGDESLDRLQFLMGSTAGRLPGVDHDLLGLDLRCDGGYIVAPPSRHRSGSCSAWIEPAVPPAPAPGWLRPPGASHLPDRSHPAAPGRGSFSLRPLRLRAEVADVRWAPVGDRNNRLNGAAFCLGMLVAGGELDEALVEAELLDAAVDVGLPESEARASISSGLRVGAREPRRLVSGPG